MIRSMTGYGSASLETPQLRASVTVRSVNHRFLDVTLHLPRRLQPLEAEMKERASAAVARGRVEVSVQASLPEAAAEAVVASARSWPRSCGPCATCRTSTASRAACRSPTSCAIPGPSSGSRSRPGCPTSARAAIGELLSRALEGLDVMRRAEGERLHRELERLLAEIEGAASRLEARAADSREERLSALVERLRALAAELGLEDGRLYQEVVRSVERHDVAEELQRLRSHCASARDLMAGEGEPSGKRLDFLAQELMREANTIGSKVQDAAAIREVVELKADIERLREQVQNVE